MQGLSYYFSEFSDEYGQVVIFCGFQVVFECCTLCGFWMPSGWWLERVGFGRFVVHYICIVCNSHYSLEDVDITQKSYTGWFSRSWNEV